MLSGDSPTDDARAAARARLAARAAHVEGGLAAAAAAEAAVASVAAGRGGDELRPVLSTLSANIPAHKTPAPRAGFKRSHIVSPPMKNVRVKNDDGLGINVARAARDLCGDLGEPKESLMRRALDCIGVVEANDIAIQVYRIEGDGGQMTRDGVQAQNPGRRLLGVAQRTRDQGGVGRYLRRGEGGTARAVQAQASRRVRRRVPRGITHLQERRRLCIPEDPGAFKRAFQTIRRRPRPRDDDEQAPRDRASWLHPGRVLGGARQGGRHAGLVRARQLGARVRARVRGEGDPR